MYGHDIDMSAVLTPAERVSLGQSRRKQLRRQDHAHWRPAAQRSSPVETLRRSMRGRIPGLVPLKYERMLASPFGFFRGAVPVMAADLAALPNAGILTQICGDAHVRNLGAYAAPDGRLIFDINDFDETCVAPFEWDLKRMATSLVLAGREQGHKNISCAEAVHAFAASYRKLAAMLARMPVLEAARYQVHRLERVTPASDALHKAERETPLNTLERLTETAEGKNKTGRRFQENPPFQTHLPPAQARAVLAALAPYRESLLPERRHFLDQYRPLDVVFKVVGTGSVALRDYLVYLEGNGVNDPLFLQLKEEPGSAYAPYLPSSPAAAHHGCAVAAGQRAMQLQSDAMLGWTTIAHRDYLVRQLNDHKASIDLQALAGSGLEEYAVLCGELLARGHARSGDVQRITGYLGEGARQDSFDQALATFADAYADQTEKDMAAVARAHRPSRARGVAPRQSPAKHGSAHPAPPAPAPEAK
jgi:uncharacterized protein (DUF2252 family)